MKFILIFALLFVLTGCAADPALIEARAQAASAVAKAAAEHQAAIEARPVRLKIVSQVMYLGGNEDVRIVEDTKTGKEYMITNSYHNTPFVVPLDKEDR